MFTAEQWPYLQPVYGGVPCSAANGSFGMVDEARDSSLPGDGEGPAQGSPTEDFEGGSTAALGSVTEDQSAARAQSRRWPHEPRFCARLWHSPAQGETDEEGHLLSA